MAIITSEEKRSGKNGDFILAGPGGPWHKRSPLGIRQSYQSPTDERGWAIWRRHLAKRKFCPLGSLLPQESSPLTWALPEDLELEPALDLIDSLHRLDSSAKRKKTEIEGNVIAWLAHPATSPATAELGLMCLAWCEALPRLTAHLPARLWWQLLNRLIAIAGDESSTPHDPLAMQLLFGELPLALAYSFGELQACRELSEGGARTISQGIDELLDGDGLPHARHLHLLRPLLACWTRSKAIGQALHQRWCEPQAQRQVDRLVEHALRLSRPGGQQVFTSTGSKPWNPTLLKAALDLVDDRATERVFRLQENGRHGLRRARGKTLPPPALESEWAGIAVLRPDWSRTAPRLTVSYVGQQVATELSLNTKCLWSGTWELDVRFNDRPCKPLGDWEQTCWVSDDDVDYLELELCLSEEVTVQRHMLLGRDDRFLFLADAVLGIQQGTIEYRGTLPIGGLSVFDAQREAREGSLSAGGRARARVLPLALNEWRAGAPRGSLQAGPSGLELTQAAHGECLFAPLFIDLDARRQRKEVTWRQLTVAYEREVTPSDVAVGYRVQVGKSQWLIYRSLAVPAVRTVLGKNLMTEFLLAHFRTDGGVEALLEIE
jgi:hypothetical protein